MNARLRGMVFWVGAAVIAVAFQLLVLDKERILASGHVMLLELAPVDPRSLMQGDYMRLDYRENSIVIPLLAETPERSGLVVIAPGEGKAARVVRRYDGGPLGPDEGLLHYTFAEDRWNGFLRPDSFLFQEGHAAAYDNARYGVFRCFGERPCLLTGLADANGALITPPVWRETPAAR